MILSELSWRAICWSRRMRRSKFCSGLVALTKHQQVSAKWLQITKIARNLFHRLKRHSKSSLSMESVSQELGEKKYPFLSALNMKSNSRYYTYLPNSFMFSSFFDTVKFIPTFLFVSQIWIGNFQMAQTPNAFILCNCFMKFDESINVVRSGKYFSFLSVYHLINLTFFQNIRHFYYQLRSLLHQHLSTCAMMFEWSTRMSISSISWHMTSTFTLNLLPMLVSMLFAKQVVWACRTSIDKIS